MFSLNSPLRVLLSMFSSLVVSFERISANVAFGPLIELNIEPRNLIGLSRTDSISVTIPVVSFF